MKDQVILQDRQGSRWLSFHRPRRVVVARHRAEVFQKLAEVEHEVKERGLYAAGFITYEAAPAFDPALVVRSPAGLPLLWFGLYERAEPIDVPTGRAPYTVDQWQSSVTRADYESAIGRVKDHIAAGETYQVNYTYRLCTPFDGQPWGLFLDLIQAQESSFAAYLDLGSQVICSASPELFFELSGTRLISRPMKGTVERGRTLVEDRSKAEWLYHSEKNRAENVMIVDMIRNDMGRVSTIGSVEVPTLFDVERYPTLWQMTSTVTSHTEASLAQIMAALFPCASITGAPKVSTMGIIAELETSPRGVYTGCIGYLAPDRQAQFNVAIRTVVVDRDAGFAEFGVGGGVVWDSGTDSEYAESLTKAKILFERRPAFQLLESLLWSPDEGFYLLEQHLERLAASATYFGFEIDVDALSARLGEAISSYPQEPQKVRLLLERNGHICLEAAPLGEVRSLTVAVAEAPVSSENVFLYHKTTNRTAYEVAKASRPGNDEVLLWNEREELTEATTANIVVKLAGELLTPPVSCGLLAGVFRGRLLAEGNVQEQVISLSDLERCQEIYLINSVRKWRRANLRP
ncbi:MAG TPA: aminodeoxychorismate synthase component I [Anaerolineae bacterium]|jgi:para-aminobenzoate synthetase/4-amino-4-deoxychorismate lyase|nr:aminodeoxychorismate synthase component I [Anaerolineae bacterium]